MSFAQRFTTGTVTCDGAGAAIGYTPNITGRVLSIQYVKTNFTNGVDMVATGKDTGIPVWTGTNVDAAVTVFPVAPCVIQAGTASTLTEEGIYLVNEPLKIVIASGGSGTTGLFYVTVV